MNKIIVFFVFLFAIFISGCSEKFLFYPPKEYGPFLPIHKFKYDRVVTDSNESIYYVEYYPSSKEKIGTILHFHGNATDISSTQIGMLRLPDYGYNLISFDYRGYGESTGETTLSGVNDDALFMIKYAISNLEEGKKLILHGYSLGGAILLRSLKDLDKKYLEKIDFIIVEGTYLSYIDLADSKFLGVGGFFLKDDFSPNQINNKLEIPMLVIHSKNDKVVPYVNGVDLSNYFYYADFLSTSGTHTEFLESIINRNILNDYVVNRIEEELREGYIVKINDTETKIIKYNDKNVDMEDEKRDINGTI